MSDESSLHSNIVLMTPQQLYELWERQHWASQAIDLEKDKGQWADMSEEERTESLWVMSAFFIGEERVTTQFSGLVMSYDDEQEEAFLTTQQVDEARHMQFFDRYYREVFQLGDAEIGDRLARARGDVTDAFATLFDEELVQAERRLIENPRDVEAKVDFVTTYHLVIEGILALTGQHFLTRYYETRDLLPGFVEGFGNISRDEHRHVAYGTWFLQQKAKDPGHARRIQDKVMELMPVTAGVLVPPGYSLGDEYEFLGYTSQEQTEFAFNSLRRRLKVIGVGLPVAA